MFKFILFFAIPMMILQGCATAFLTGTATTVSVAHDRRTAGSIIDDQSIEFKASYALFNDKELYDKSHVNVTSYNGVILITGETLSATLKQKISAKIKAIPKVRHIYNDLIIAAPSALPSRSSDAWITSKIKAKLTTAKEIDPFYIKVITEHGVVYLMGLVSREEAEKVVAVVTQSDGVQRVIKIFEYIELEP